MHIEISTFACLAFGPRTTLHMVGEGIKARLMMVRKNILEVHTMRLTFMWISRTDHYSNLPEYRDPNFIKYLFEKKS